MKGSTSGQAAAPKRRLCVCAWLGCSRNKVCSCFFCIPGHSVGGGAAACEAGCLSKTEAPGGSISGVLVGLAVGVLQLVTKLFEAVAGVQTVTSKCYAVSVLIIIMLPFKP